MDHLEVGRPARRQAGSDDEVEPRAHDQRHIRLAEGLRARRDEAEIVVFRHDAATLGSGVEGDARCLHKLPQFGRSVRPEDARAGQDDRALGVGQQLDRFLDLVGIRARPRPRRARIGEPDRLVVRLLVERVAGQVEVGRPRLGALRLAVGEVEELGHPRRVRHAAGPAGDRHRHRELVVLLEVVALERRERRRAPQRDHRHTVEVGVGHPGQQVGRGRPGGGHADAGQPLHAGVPVRGHRRALLVAAVNRANPVLGGEPRRLDDWPAHDVEEVLDPLVHHLSSEQFRSHLLRHVPIPFPSSRSPRQGGSCRRLRGVLWRTTLSPAPRSDAAPVARS